MLLTVRTAPYGISDPLETGASTSSAALPTDENLIPFVRLFPGIPPPPPLNLSTPKGFLTEAVALKYIQITPGACKILRIRNTANRYLRVAKSVPSPNPAVDLTNFDLHFDYTTIAPKFFEAFACEDSGEYFVAFADGAGGAERIEIVRDGQV